MSDALRLVDPGRWPALAIQQVGEPYAGADHGVRDDRAVVLGTYGTAVLRRDTMSVTFHAETTLSDAEIVHPCLWPVAAIAARWLGRETLHGGGFLDAGGGAWVVLGDSGDGKSSLLASLALSGKPVLADDLVVVDGRHCFAGPRCIDLLPETAERLGVSDQTTEVRWSERQRLILEPIAARVPLHGFVYLAWDERVSVQRLAPAARPARLANQRRVPHLGVDPVALLDLAGLPALVVQRPREWGSMAEARRLLVDAVNGA